MHVGQISCANCVEKSIPPNFIRFGSNGKRKKSIFSRPNILLSIFQSLKKFLLCIRVVSGRLLQLLNFENFGRV